MRSRNNIILKKFIKYCEANPSLRFWQALRNFSGVNFLWVSNGRDVDGGEFRDTYYFEKLTK